MWELIAPILRWPLYSPRRLISIVVLVVAAVVVAGELNGDDTAPAVADEAPVESASPNTDNTQSEADSTSTPSPSTQQEITWPDTSPTPQDDAEPGDEAGHTDALSGDPAADNPSLAAADAATAFVAAWARPDLERAAWEAGVRPLVTPELWAAGLGDTDPANTPEVTVAGEPVQVAINAEEGVFDVPTTGPWVRVHVALTDDSTWLAARVEPVA